MGTRIRRFRHRSLSRERFGKREEHRERGSRAIRGHAEHLGGRDERASSRDGRRPGEFKARTQEQELENREARERIRRENEEFDRNRVALRRFSPPPPRSRERPVEEGHPRSRAHRSRSPLRRGRSLERSSRNAEVERLRFEPPHEFARNLSPRRNDVRGAQFGHHDAAESNVRGPHRFSPPRRAEFHDVEFEQQSGYRQGAYEDSSYPRAESGRSDAPAFTEKREFGHSKGFLPPPVLDSTAEFSQNAQRFGFEQEFAPKYSSSVDEKIGDMDGEAPLVPEFNPETSKLSAHDWVKLVEEIARQQDWKKDEKQYIMASRLAGFARQWYLMTGVNCKKWGDLRQAFMAAFPTEMNFHSLLHKMLLRVKEENESMASYFHHKVALLRACEIEGRKAVSCIIGGLQNPKHRHQANVHNFEDPDDLYAFLRTFDAETPLIPKKNPLDPKNKFCYNCKCMGHIRAQCPKVRTKSTLDNLKVNEAEKDVVSASTNRVMHGSLSRKPTYSKYFTEVNINGIMLKAYVDQASESTTIRQEDAAILKLPFKKIYKTVKGFCGSTLSSIGIVDVPLCIDRALANVQLAVVPDHLQAIPLIVGQSFTEQPHVVVMKDGDRVRFYQRMDNGKANFDF